MARDGISFEQVATAADALVAEGLPPTIRAIRERLGTGSPNTVHRHLTAWREGRGRTDGALKLSQSLTAAIVAELEHVAEQARAGIEECLTQAQAENADLARAGEALEAEQRALMDRVAALTSERDNLAGKAAAQGERMGEQAGEIERLRAALEGEREKRTVAEQQAAVLGAKLDGVEQARVGLEGSLMQAQAKNVDLARAGEALEAKQHALMDRVAALTSERDTLAGKAATQGEEIEHLRAALEDERNAHANVEQQAAVLAAKLESMSERAIAAEGRAEQAAAEVRKAGEAAAELRGRLGKK